MKTRARPQRTARRGEKDEADPRNRNAIKGEAMEERKGRGREKKRGKNGDR